MATQKISQTDMFYFNFHIISTFAEYLNNIEQRSYEKLTDDWWYNMAEKYIPLMNADDRNIKEIKKNIFDEVMNHFPKKFLTKKQNTQLFKFLGDAICAYIDSYKVVCYCGERRAVFALIAVVVLIPTTGNKNS
jgi:hypothetical protein